jgi:hypothetical protein
LFLQKDSIRTLKEQDKNKYFLGFPFKLGQIEQA